MNDFERNFIWILFFLHLDFILIFYTYVMPDYIDYIITNAYKHRASDIHIDPEFDFISIRYRIDGVIYDIEKVAKALHSELIARIKILSGMRVDERFKPQDGRWSYGGIDIRVSVIPTMYGENAVFRILEKKNTSFSLANLGMGEEHIQTMSDVLKKDKGIILVSGPTGSGKTTTLYTLLSYFVEQKKIVVTIEDPVEYTLNGVRQIQTRTHHITFASGLRAILRQDPDVIMIGEIRDAETASVAVNAALTGHVVLSTIHTNSAAAVKARLIDMGIPEFQIQAISLVAIAQRLIRLVCKGCDGEGCNECDERGYKGRKAIYEIKNTGIYKTMYEYAHAMAEQGETTHAEVERVLGKGIDI